MSTSIQRRESGGVLTIAFNRDEKLNAVNDEMIEHLRRGVHDLETRDDVRVLVITGRGRYFTAGIDINGLNAEDRPSTSGVARRRTARRIHDLFDRFESVEKPVIVAANGPCLGFGVEMACSCDFRLAAADATFALPEVPNLAVLPGSGGVSRLTRLVGPHWARWMAMAGRSVDAERALSIGFVHEVYPADSFDQKVEEFAASLVEFSAEALALAKLTIDASVSADSATARDIDRIANTILMGSPDHAAKVAAFQRRSPSKGN